MDATKRRVLVVDDELLFRVMMKQLLRNSNYEVVDEAGNGQDAIAKFEVCRPDIVLMDVMMPDMDGVAAIRRILEIEPKACVIICSALGAQRVLLEALEVGARDYVVKPFTRQKVLEALDKASAN